MQLLLNTLDTKGPLDYDNLNIVTHPSPPRRRKSGTSLIPFRPYVKCLTSVRQPSSFVDGIDKWKVTGKDEAFFTQPNARCIGSLLGDCEMSDVIRWDIEAESTHLPMMCKLWMIVDGAVVERGKPHLVQDAAVQVCTTGLNRRAIGAAEQRYNQNSLTTTNISASERRRRQSWQDVNEYHSVPYYQYSRSIRTAFLKGTQCDLDNEYSVGKQEVLTGINEQIHGSHINGYREESLEITVHVQSAAQERVHVSITKQTESPFTTRPTATDAQLIQLFNLNLEKNEILLSSMVNPYRRASTSNEFSQMTTTYRNGRQYHSRAVSTGDDYPHWWVRLSTDLILSDYITNQSEEKETSFSAPSPRHDQSIQTDVEKSRPSSSRSSHLQKSSSSVTTTNYYELTDEVNDRNTSRRHLTFPDDNQKVGYSLFVSSLSQQQQQASTPESFTRHRSRCRCPLHDDIRNQNSENASTTVITTLLDRYERTLRERQRAFTIINDQLLDIDDVLQHYRNKMAYLDTEESNTAMTLYRDLPLLSTDDRSISTITNITRDKYRTMPGITSEEMIRGYIPSPRVYLTSSTIVSPRERPRRYISPPREIQRPGYCDLCLTNHSTGSAWVQYNERRVEELQKRIDLMLQIDDSEEAELLLSSSLYPSTTTVKQRIDDVLTTRSNYRYPFSYYSDRMITPRRYEYRLNQSLPSTPRRSSRNVTRSTTPVSKSVRISTRSISPNIRSRPYLSGASRPTVSILRHRSVPSTPRSSIISEKPHIWRSKVDGKVYALKQFNIPRYYRLYNDVSFRQMYDFSRMLDTSLIPRDYSSLLTSYALEQQILSPIISAA